MIKLLSFIFISILFVYLFTAFPLTIKAQGVFSCSWEASTSDCYPSSVNCDPGCRADCDVYDAGSSASCTTQQNVTCRCLGLDWNDLYNQVFTNPGAWGARLSTATTIGTIISALLNFIFPIAGLLLFLYFVYGGYLLMTSAGNPQNVQAAKAMITTALLGFTIIFAAYWIVQAVGIMLGLGQLGNIF